MLRDRGGLEASGGFLEVCGQQFAASVSEGVADAPEEVPTATTANYLRFGSPRLMVDTLRTPWRESPSTLAPVAPQTPLAVDTVAFAQAIDTSGVTFESATDHGTILHLAFRVLTNRPDLSGQLAAATGLGQEVLDAIQNQADTLRNWLAAKGYDQLHFELPLQEIRPDGSQTNAIIDCLAEGPEGSVILDHKSGRCPDPEARFYGYLPQLQSYARLMALTRPYKPVRGLAINWIDEGKLSFYPVDAKEFA